MIYKDGFVEWLESKMGKARFNGSKTEIITFCPWCEGPSTTKKHGHLYVDVNEPVFYCQKCGGDKDAGTGLVLKLIVKLGGNFEDFLDPSMITRSTHAYTRKNLDGRRNVANFKSCEATSTDVTNYEVKTSYLYKRFGRVMDLQKIPRLIFSIKAFLRENNIECPENQKYFLDELDRNYVGFVSTKGTTVIMRNCTDFGYRYYKFPLVDDTFFFSDFYGIRTGMVTPEIPTVVLCEGVFDMITPLVNTGLESLKIKSTYWAAALGKGGLQKTLIGVLDYCRVVKVNVHVLSDLDVPWYFYYKMRDLPFIDRFYIHYNKSGKDFGDLPINPTTRELKPKVRRKDWYAKSSHS